MKKKWLLCERVSERTPTSFFVATKLFSFPVSEHLKWKLGPVCSTLRICIYELNELNSYFCWDDWIPKIFFGYPTLPLPPKSPNTPHIYHILPMGIVTILCHTIPYIPYNTRKLMAYLPYYSMYTKLYHVISSIYTILFHICILYQGSCWHIYHIAPYMYIITC